MSSGRGTVACQRQASRGAAVTGNAAALARRLAGDQPGQPEMQHGTGRALTLDAYNFAVGVPYARQAAARLG